MQNIEPYYRWRDDYVASEDQYSPFYGREYSEFEYSQTIYNYYIHPQWDYMGSPTLYIKILFVDYDEQYTIIELLGEWNDCIENDIMTFKRNIIDPMLQQGIRKFILIGENVLNFHADDESYYEEWYEDVIEESGWVAMINIRQHVEDEMINNNLHLYINLGGHLNNVAWRPLKPIHVLNTVEYCLHGGRQLSAG